MTVRKSFSQLSDGQGSVKLDIPQTYDNPSEAVCIMYI